MIIEIRDLMGNLGVLNNDFGVYYYLIKDNKKTLKMSDIFFDEREISVKFDDECKEVIRAKILKELEK